jgi:hypothetical protein
MSDHGVPSPGDNSSKSSTPKSSRPSLNYEFIDSQDPNTKSQIQRHTAHHAVQQRREAARQRLLREGSTPRLFKWQRRPNAESTSPPSSSSIASPLPASPPTEPSIAKAPADRSSVPDESSQKHDLTSSPDEHQKPIIMPYTAVEEALLEYCTFCVSCRW